MEDALNALSIANIVEDHLKREKLSFLKCERKNLIVFKNVQIGENCSIIVGENVIKIKINLVLSKEKKIIKRLSGNFCSMYSCVSCYSNMNKEGDTFHIIIAPFKKEIFKEIFFQITLELQREISPFILGIVTENPRDFLINQYRIWKSIPSEEQNRILEDILIIKEKYFKNAKTPVGIINKLNKKKRELAVFMDGHHDTPLSDEEYYVELYLLDFAALFRGLELRLIKFNLENFFENFKGAK